MPGLLLLTLRAAIRLVWCLIVQKAPRNKYEWPPTVSRHDNPRLYREAIAANFIFLIIMIIVVGFNVLRHGFQLMYFPDHAK